jgi:hypothetical protein
MTPEELRLVQDSWRQVLLEREAVQAVLTRRFRQVVATSKDAAERACWLFRAVEELVELLPAPSRLEQHARHLGDTWPDPVVAPSFAIDGQAWMFAAASCVPGWTPGVERAWRQAWLLLSEVLAAETLSPFAGERPASAERSPEA